MTMEKGERDGQRWTSTLIREHRHHINDLTVTSNSVLLASLDNNLTRLQCLKLVWADSTSCMHPQEFMDEKNASNNSNGDDDGGEGVGTPFSETLDECPWEEEEEVPRTVITELYHGDAALTRASWLLVLRNPGLRELTFKWSWPKVGFKKVLVPRSQSVLHYTLHSERAAFLTATLSRLSALRHLEIGYGAYDYLLCHLTAILPRLESFIHVDRVNFDPKEIESAMPHRSLKRLEFSAVVTVAQLRALVKGFPGLIHFSTVWIKCDTSDGYQDNMVDNGLTTSTKTTPTTTTTTTKGASEARKEVLEWSFMESLNISSRHYEITGVLEARIRFLRLTQLGRRIQLRCSNVIRKLLWAFPALQSLDSYNQSYNQSSVDMVFSAEEERLLLSVGADDIYAIQELNLDTLDLDLPNMRGFLARMPSLFTLRVAHGAIDGTALLDVTRMFKHL